MNMKRRRRRTKSATQKPLFWVGMVAALVGLGSVAVYSMGAVEADNASDKRERFQIRQAQRAALANGTLTPASLTGEPVMPEPADGAVKPGLLRVHVLGDSFAVFKTFQAMLRDELPEYQLTFDAVGGTTLSEQADRYSSTLRARVEPLVILDGGLGTPSELEGFSRIIDLQQKECGIWFYVEPVQRAAPRNMRGMPRYVEQAEAIAELRSRYPDNFIPIIDTLQANADGSSADASDVANGWVPSSLRKDFVHLNDQGNAILAKIIADKIRAANIAAKPGCLKSGA